jgi:hypothetical protein
MAPDVEDHSADPEKDGADTIYHSAFTKRHEKRVPDRVKQVLKDDSRDIVGYREHRPANHDISRERFQKRATGNNISSINRLYEMALHSRARTRLQQSAGRDSHAKNRGGGVRGVT